MVIIEFKKHHFVFAVRAFQGIIAEGRKNGGAPLVKTAVYRMFAFGNNPIVSSNGSSGHLMSGSS